VLFDAGLDDVSDAMNHLWRAFGQSPDHVVPLGADGSNELSNVVRACGTCNYSKSACSLEELGLEDPRKREPIRDGWRGLLGRPTIV